VFQHREVRVDLVLAEVEPVPDAVEGVPEIVCDGRTNEGGDYSFLL
jgi:hypothetical protein